MHNTTLQLQHPAVLHRPVHGLIFLFKWTSEADARPTLKETEGTNVFFAKQVISNACATQAILAVLLNAEGLKDKLGEQLTQFREFTAGFPPGQAAPLLLPLHTYSLHTFTPPGVDMRLAQAFRTVTSASADLALTFLSH